MMWGTTRALVNNMVTGVSHGFSGQSRDQRRRLSRRGAGQEPGLQLGFSHDVIFPIPDDIKITCEKPTAITITGADRQHVGQVAAEIRALPQARALQGQGHQYANETVRRKEGKKK